MPEFRRQSWSEAGGKIGCSRISGRERKVAEQSLEIDTELLAAGAARCGDAAGMAVGGAKKLADKSPSAGIFGDFAEAHAFHDAVSAAHQGHVQQLIEHHRALSTVGEKSHGGKFLTGMALT